MSRNFELLAEIEKELDQGSSDSGNHTAHPATPASPLLEQVPPVIDGELSGLVQRVFLAPTELAHRDAVFCGVERTNGSSSICARVGRTLAASTTETVCLVGANSVPSGLAGQFGAMSSRRGSVLGGEMDTCVQVGVNLWLATYGESHLDEQPPRAASLRSMVDRLRHQFDYLLIDAGGLGGHDAVTLGLSDSAILVIEAEKTRRAAARKAKQTLEAAGVRVVGTVLCNRTFPVPKALYDRL